MFKFGFFIGREKCRNKERHEKKEAPPRGEKRYEIGRDESLWARMHMREISEFASQFQHNQAHAFEHLENIRNTRLLIDKRLNEIHERNKKLSDLACDKTDSSESDPSIEAITDIFNKDK